MAITKFTEDVNIIAALDDLPNDNDGLSAQQLKEKFDAAAILIQNYINEILTPELDAAIAAAAQGITTEGISGSLISDGTINSAKLNQNAGFEAVITAAIRDLAITRAKIAFKAIGSAQLDDLAVITAKLANNGVTEGKLSAEVREKLNRIITEAMLDSSLQEKINSHQKVHKEISVTLTSGETTWTVSATGVTASNAVVVTPNPDSFTLWRNHGIRCTEQGADSLTFVADTAPASDVTANVLIFD